ncbi:MAG: dihydrodipicolinate reductase [Bacilli bacterium]|nr:dihydrodipicolinate reductase [Bacilli bacterium]
MTKIKAFQIGCGRMSKYIMEYIYNLKGEIVGAVDIDETKVGQDISTVIECSPKNVVINDISKLEELLKETNPDIAIITTMSFLNDVEAPIRTCVRCGVNVITTSEECFFASNSNPTLFKELDILAKANNVTITGCGYQDVFWGNLITVLAGSTHKITKIKGSSSYNVEDYGIALAEAHGAGLTLDEFEEKIASADNISETKRSKIINERKFSPSYMWNAAGWIADKMHLTPKRLTQKCVPMTSDTDLHSETLNMDIKAGMATGMSAIATLETEEGITIEAECIGKVYGPDDFDKNEWTVEGEPSTTITVNRPDTVRLTCADVVNRIPDVINAQPGFISTSELNESTYKVTY